LPDQNLKLPDQDFLRLIKRSYNLTVKIPVFGNLNIYKVNIQLNMKYSFEPPNPKELQV